MKLLTQRNFPLFRNAALILLLLLGGFVLVNNFKPAKKDTLKPLPQDPVVKVYFNQNQALTYEDPYRRLTRKGDNLEQQIIDAIGQAQSTVDVAVMQFRLPKVAQALILAHKRKVKVRVVIDNQFNKTLADFTTAEIAKMNPYEQQAYKELKLYPADGLTMLRSSGIEVKDDTSGGATKGSGLMHHKFIVIDSRTTIVSSANLTTSDIHGDFSHLESRGNPNNMVVILNNLKIAQTFTEEFNYMWQGLFKSRKPKRNPVTIPAGAGTITLNFSPDRRKTNIASTSNGIIASYVEQAQKSVHVAVFVYSDQHISDTLGRVSDRGVKDIKVLVDPDFFRQPYSKAYDALGVCPRRSKRNYLTQVKPWKNPITTVGFPIAPTGDRGVHSKMAILDGTLVITGSHNWSVAGNYSNDETVMFIQNSTVAAHYEREFSRLYATANLGLKTVPAAQKCDSYSYSLLQGATK